MLRLVLPASRFGEAERERERRRWNRLWRAGLPEGIVLEDLSHEGSPSASGIFVGAFVLPEVHDRIVRERTLPLLDGLADAAESGEATLTEAEIARANVGEGIDIVICWAGFGDVPPAIAAGLRSHALAAFHALMAGNRMRRTSVETTKPEIRRLLEHHGMETIREAEGAAIVSLHRDQALAGIDFASHRFFSYDPPVLGFSAAQRAILLLARRGYTDQEIAAALGKTTDSVKKRWAGIYGRFATAFPGRLPVSGDGSRGQEKRRTLLAYLKDRPEELRPYGAASE